jgi:2-oxo-4-hydroxy-4-carboxy-5-ureidoimidazoline decarboxylase
MIETTADDLRAALGVERWVAAVQFHSPFDSLESLLSIAHIEATPLSDSEIDEAIAHHPRIGEKPAGDGKSAAFSRTEQGEDDPAVAEALADGNARYEQTFGRVFIIRAAGRSRAEILDELNRRIELDDAEELLIVGEQLRDIAVLRLAKLFTEEL